MRCPFQEDKFDLVIAIGVIPWLHDEDAALLRQRSGRDVWNKGFAVFY